MNSLCCQGFYFIFPIADPIAVAALFQPHYFIG
jgi:hypothetical protein